MNWLAGGELVVGSSEDFLPSQFPCIVPTRSLIVPDASLWGVIAVRFYQPQLTHTLDTKAGSASQTIAGSPYRTVERGCSLDGRCTGSAYIHWTISTHTLDAGYCVPVTRTPDDQTRLPWADCCTVEKSSHGQQTRAASWLCLGQPQISSPPPL